MPLENDSKNDDKSNSLVVKVRGLPWSTTVDEILKFFAGCNVAQGKDGVYIVQTKEGRPSGEAFIEMETDEDIENALKKDREYVGSRYIEVFRCKRSEMEWVVRRSGSSADSALDDGCVSLRGLPFGCSKEEIAQFFTGLEIVPNGIHLQIDSRGRSTGEAFVQFRSKEIAEKALLKHKENIGHRYIEIFPSSLSEIFPEGRRSMGGGYSSRPTPYDSRNRFGGPNRFRGGSSGPGPNGPIGSLMPPGPGGRGGFRGGNDMDEDEWAWRFRRGGVGNGGGPMGGMGMGFNGGFGGDFGPGAGFGGNFGGNGGFNGPPGPHIIQMRGLPFRATKQDIADFFRPIIPLSIDLNPSDKGFAEVEFRTYEDARLAMNKDKSYMFHRYIELFFDKPMNGSDGGRSSNMGGGNSGGGGGGGARSSSIPGSRFKRF